MAINLQRTGSIGANCVKILVYGQSGAGKTFLIPSLPDVVAFSAEGGLMSIKDADIPFISISSIEDLRDAYKWATDSQESAQFKSFAIDSISEIAEVVLAHEKKRARDPRQAYGAMQDEMADIIRRFRDIPDRHVYMSAKLEKIQDEMGRLLYGPSMPGNKAAQAIPYFFDEVFALRVEKNEDGEPIRGVLCKPDGQWQAKDRSGKLDLWEVPDLGEIIRKIGGEQ
jgi:hypothetical protein